MLQTVMYVAVCWWRAGHQATNMAAWGTLAEHSLHNFDCDGNLSACALQTANSKVQCLWITTTYTAWQKGWFESKLLSLLFLCDWPKFLVSFISADVLANPKPQFPKTFRLTVWGYEIRFLIVANNVFCSSAGDKFQQKYIKICFEEYHPCLLGKIWKDNRYPPFRWPCRESVVRKSTLADFGLRRVENFWPFPSLG